MAFKCDTYHIIQKTAISAGIYSFTILCPEVAKLARAGQFVHVKIDGFTLRRPISICDIDFENGTIRIVFEIRGAGTGRLADLNVGDNIDIIAPLGNGFTIPENIDNDERLIFVGGGIGVPPMLGAAKIMPKNSAAILGFRSYDKIILTGDFKENGIDVITCTDDGSVGFHGMVTEPLKEELKRSKVKMVYACGPTPMLKAIIDVCKNENVKCQVSLEQRMGCGVGACAVCTCIVNRGGQEYFLRVCKDGPIFKGEEVVL